MARIVTVYTSSKQKFQLSDMSHIRWLKISEALSLLGHEVDIATNEDIWDEGWWRKTQPIRMGERLRRVPLSEIRWGEYDVVKTLFHMGFDTLEAYGGVDHPFIISKLGSVVAPEDTEGIYFYGKIREQLYSTQREIDRNSKYVTVLSQPAKDLWRNCFGQKANILIVPGAVDSDIPPPRRNPFPDDNQPRCIFAGNIYYTRSQPEANRVLVAKLNRLGELLERRGIRLFAIGAGELSHLDPRWVTHLGLIPYAESWDYFYFANAGVVVSAGPYMHNNESSKIYHYLRAGLPVVSERGFPNDHVVVESRMGFIVDNSDMDIMAARVEEAVHAKWDRDFAIKYILQNHTWEKRVGTYAKLIENA